MIIIIEGIDRVGKTTLAQKLSGEFGIPILKQERIGGNEQSTDDSALINYGRAVGLIDFWNWEGFNQNIIVDRFHWTEAVYSLIDRHSPEVRTMMENIEVEMLKQKDKYFIIQVMPVDIKWSSRQHGSDLVRHQKEFDDLYNKSKLNKYRCTYYSFDMCINEIERRLNNGTSK